MMAYFRRIAQPSSSAVIVLVSAASLLCTQLGDEREGNAAMALRLTSSGFTDGQEIPARQTCQGGDVSPGLQWSAAPKGTKSFAIVIDDPDAPDPSAPKTTWVHWVVYDIPSNVSSL